MNTTYNTTLEPLITPIPRNDISWDIFIVLILVVIGIVICASVCSLDLNLCGIPKRIIRCIRINKHNNDDNTNDYINDNINHIDNSIYPLTNQLTSLTNNVTSPLTDINGKNGKNGKIGKIEYHPLKYLRAEMECSICLDKIGMNNNIFKLNCNHLYHLKCWNTWILDNHLPNCPLCRYDGNV